MEKITCFKCGKVLSSVELITEGGCVFCDKEFSKKYKHKLEGRK